MERSFHIKQSIKLLSKPEYYEAHHFPNQNPVKRSLADPTPWLEKTQQLEEDFLQQSNDSTSVFLKENLSKLNFERKSLDLSNAFLQKKTLEKKNANLVKNAEIFFPKKTREISKENPNSSFTFDSVKIQEKLLDFPKKEDAEIFALKEENTRLKAGFIEKEKAYIEEIENITREILAIKEKYKVFEVQIEGLMEEKNEMIEKLKTELRNSHEISDFSLRKTQESECFKTFFPRKKPDFSEENKRILERKNALECDFLVLSIENERLNGVVHEKTRRNLVSEEAFQRKYKELERILEAEREEFKRSIERMKRKRLECEASEKSAVFFPQKSEEDLKEKSALLSKDLLRRNEDFKENMVFREVN